MGSEEAGADLVASTLRGYTNETRQILTFEPDFVRVLTQKLKVPVISEGRIATPDQAREAIRAGAYAVIVGTAVTCPREITNA